MKPPNCSAPNYFFTLHSTSAGIARPEHGISTTGPRSTCSSSRMSLACTSTWARPSSFSFGTFLNFLTGSHWPMDSMSCTRMKWEGNCTNCCMKWIRIQESRSGHQWGTQKKEILVKDRVKGPLREPFAVQSTWTMVWEISSRGVSMKCLMGMSCSALPCSKMTCPGCVMTLSPPRWAMTGWRPWPRPSCSTSTWTSPV